MARRSRTSGALGRMRVSDARRFKVSFTHEGRREIRNTKQQVQAERMAFRRDQSAAAQEATPYTDLPEGSAVKQVALAVIIAFATTSRSKSGLNLTQTAAETALSEMRSGGELPTEEDTRRGINIATRALKSVYDQVVQQRAEVRGHFDNGDDYEYDAED